MSFVDVMMKYDVIIIGCGFAGLACSIQLLKNGITCMMLEKGNNLLGKVCGDGLTVSAIKYLERIDIDILSLNGKKVYSKVIHKDGESQEMYFAELFSRNYEYGISRDVLINHILGHAVELGAEIIWNHDCRSIERENNSYCIDGRYYADEVVLAGGVSSRKNLLEALPKDIPTGMSARIYGKCGYSDKSFHYFYDERYGDGYAWLFPVGEDLWNIGVYRCASRNLKKLYYNFENKIFGNDYRFSYERKPKGALIGASREKFVNEKPFWIIGDCALSASFETGEGISFAIRDGISAAERIIVKRR